MVQELINFGVQAAVVFFIAAIVYLIGLFFSKPPRDSFFKSIGLIFPTAKSMRWALLASLIFVPATLAMFMTGPMRELAAGENTVAGAVRSLGWSPETLVVIFILAFLKTSFTEELLFRGVIAKRLIKGFGFFTGNTLQAILFASIHLLIFLPENGPEFSWSLAAPILLVPGAMAWAVCWLNEKAGNGSIAPGWFIHGIGNAIAYPVLAFA